MAGRVGGVSDVVATQKLAGRPVLAAGLTVLSWVGLSFVGFVAQALLMLPMLLAGEFMGLLLGEAESLTDGPSPSTLALLGLYFVVLVILWLGIGWIGSRIGSGFRTPWWLSWIAPGLSSLLVFLVGGVFRQPEQGYWVAVVVVSIVGLYSGTGLHWVLRRRRAGAD